MAKKRNDLAFSGMPTKLEGYFAFISGATTVSGLFLGLFGLTAFGAFLTGDTNISMYTVLQGLSLLPNPLEFIRDCNQILVKLGGMISGLDMSISNSSMPDILKAVLSIFTMLFRIGTYVLAFLVSALLLPFYLIWFSARCIAVLFSAIGMQSYIDIGILNTWQPVSWVLGILGGV